MVKVVENKAANNCNCPKCADRGRRLSFQEFAHRAVPIPPDPAWEANPPSEEELAASKALDLARANLQKTQEEYAVIERKVALAQGGEVWDGRKSHYVAPDPEVSKNGVALRTEALGRLLAAKDRVRAAGALFNKLHAQRIARINQWRAEREAERNAKARKPAERPIAALFSKILAR